MATSRNEATMTRSRWSCPARAVGQRLLVGGHRRSGGLDVEVEGHRGVPVEEVQHLLEGGDPEIVVAGGPAPVGVGIGRQAGAHVGPGGEPVGVVEAPDLGQGQGVDGTGPVGGPVDGVVMAHHQHPVGGGVHVEFDTGGPELEGPTDGEEGRRRRLPGPALMGVGDDPPPQPRVTGGAQWQS